MKKDNKNKNEIKNKIRELIKEYYDIPPAPFNPDSDKVELSFPSYSGEDVAEALDSIFNGWPTIGPKVRQVEDKIADFIGVKNAVMVNSGASANFLTLYLLSSPYAGDKHRLNPGDEVITPAVTWITTAAPIIQNGCIPVFTDVNLGSYDINVKEIEKNITKKTRALMIVHPMGCACEMDKVNDICKKHGLILIEDCCESIGTKYGKKYVGSFGEFGTFSFYFSHHITSIEGGIIVTNNDGYADAFRCMRSNGWYREIRDEKLKEKVVAKNPGIDTSFMFPFIGFNFKPTDFAAGLVLNQIDRLGDFIKKRALIAGRLTETLQKYSDYLHLPRAHELCRHGWFTYAITVKENSRYSKKDLTDFLKKKRIATRPIIAGNITDQPFLKDFSFRKGDLHNSELVMKNGFFVGIHHMMDERQIKYMTNAFEEFFA